MATKRKKSKSTAKRRRTGATTWNKFVKRHAGEGHSMTELGKMYRSSGAYKGKKKSGGKKRRRSSLSVDTNSRKFKSFSAKFRKHLIDELVDRGISIATAKKKVSEALMSDGPGLTDMVNAYKEENKTEYEKAQEEIKKAKARRKEKEDERYIASLKRRIALADKKSEREAARKAKNARDLEAARRMQTSFQKTLEEAEKKLASID